jgi:aminopeptidase N
MSSDRTARIVPLIAYAAFLSSLGAVAIADPFPRQPGIDIQKYIFRLELRDDSDSISGTAQIEFLLREDGVRALTVDLIGKSADGKSGISVSAVQSGNHSLPYHQNSDQLKISLDAESRKGERRQITIEYEGHPTDGLLIGPNRKGERVFFADNFPNRCRYWLPVIDHPYDKAQCEFLVTAPEAYQVIAPGALLETSSLPNHRRLTRYLESEPIATYCMVIGVARFATQVSGTPGGIPVQTWVYASERDAGFSDYAVALKPVEFFSWRIAPFPYEKLASVQSRTRYGGMENASAIFFPERSVGGENHLENLFAHEIAHQWFGDSVTESDWDDIWLSEGFATYFTHIYNEFSHGRDALARGLSRDRQDILQYFEKKPDSAIVTPADAKLDNILNTNTYQKGSWFLHMLRRQVGDPAFWQGISTYFRRYRGGNARTGDFRNVMEEASGQLLETFFRQWVYRPGQPVIGGSWAFSGNELRLELRQTQQGEPFAVSVDVGIVTDRSAPMKTQTLKLDQKEQKFRIPLEREPHDVVLDPNIWLLMQPGEFRKSQ